MTSSMADGCRWSHTTGVRRRGWWGFEEQAPYLELAETQLRSRVPASGELSVLEASFPDAVDEVGLSLLEGLNGPGWGPGAARIPKNMVGKIRWNAAFVYLDPVRARPQPEDSGGDARRPARLRGHATNRNHRPYCRRSVMRSVLGG